LFWLKTKKVFPRDLLAVEEAVEVALLRDELRCGKRRGEEHDRPGERETHARVATTFPAEEKPLGLTGRTVGMTRRRA
jgi:hypothetical protein